MPLCNIMSPEGLGFCPVCLFVHLFISAPVFAENYYHNILDSKIMVAVAKIWIIQKLHEP